MIQQCLDLALARAFVPDPLDSGVALSRRFANRPLVAVTLYKDGFEAVAVTFADGRPRFGAAEFCPAGAEETETAFLRAFADRHKARECLVAVAGGYTAVLSSRARRPESGEDAVALLRDNPERLLGEAAAPGCRHSLAYHPTHNFAVVFTHREAEIAAAAGLASRAGLGLARLQCGVSSLLIHIVGHCWPEVGREAELLLVERTSVFYLPLAEGAFGRPLFDIGLKESALRQAVEERIGKLKPGGRVILVNASGLDVAGMIAASPGAPAVIAPLKDESHPALLACCSDRPQLGYDLYPAARTVRPFAPARLRIVPLAFWVSAAASILFIGINAFRTAQSNRLAAGLSHQVEILGEANTRMDGVIRDVDARRKTALDLRDWLLVSPPTQSLLIGITQEIAEATDQGIRQNKPVARLDSLALTRQEGQPQMRLTLVLIGDAAAANRVFQRISTLFGRLGYSTVDLRESLVPQGFRYEHLLNVPKTLAP